MQRNREQPLKRGKHVTGKEGRCSALSGAVGKTRSCVTTLNADNLRSVVDS